MQNFQHCQNRQNQIKKHFPSQKIVLNKNGKISLSKSTRVNSQLSAKIQQINLLKSQVFQLKSKLQKQKAESKKISILSDEIKKVKQKLIEKVNQKQAKQRRNPEQHSDEAISQYFGLSQEQLNQEQDVTSKSYKKGPEQNQKMKQSTQNIFKNFSLFNSASKKSQQQKINGIEMGSVESQGTPNCDHNQPDYLLMQDTARNIQEKKQNLNRLKFKKNLGSFFQDKTVKNDHDRQRNNSKPFFYNKFQLEELSDQRNRLEETKKFSIVSFKKKMKK